LLLHRRKNTQQITSLLFGYGIETRKEEKQLLLKTKTKT